MPRARIDIMEGRPPEKIRELHGRVAALGAEILDTPLERVRTYITQFPPEGWGIRGGPALTPPFPAGGRGHRRRARRRAPRRRGRGPPGGSGAAGGHVSPEPGEQ